MPSPAQPISDFATQHPSLSTMLAQAAAAGHTTLNAAQLETLLAALGLPHSVEAPPTVQPGLVEIGIKLYRTREFGMIVSAGLGGPDAQLDATHFKKDSALVSASAELTDAGQFLKLFQRTLVYQQAARMARQMGNPPPDQALQACFGQVTGHRSCFERSGERFHAESA